MLPGFRLSLGYTLTYLSLIVLIPLAGLASSRRTLGWARFWEAVAAPRALAAYRLTFGAAFAAATINVVFGLVVGLGAGALRVSGKGFVDALVDLPFALPTAVAGIALTALYAENGWLGRFLEPLGLKVAFAPAGVAVAMIFVGLPFVVRTRAAGADGDRRPDGRGGGHAGRVALDDRAARDPARRHCRAR